MNIIFKKPALAFVKVLKQMHEIKCSDENCEKCQEFEQKITEINNL